jgi:hypothetical protein
LKFNDEYILTIAVNENDKVEVPPRYVPVHLVLLCVGTIDDDLNIPLQVFRQGHLYQHLLSLCKRLLLIIVESVLLLNVLDALESNAPNSSAETSMSPCLKRILLHRKQSIVASNLGSTNKTKLFSAKETLSRLNDEGVSEVAQRSVVGGWRESTPMRKETF